MATFNHTRARPAVAASPIVTADRATGHTHEGGRGYARDLHSELFLLAVSHMVGEGSFYERAQDRDARYVQLVRQAAVQHPQLAVKMLRWLRTGGNLRTAPLVGAAEFVHARLDAGIAETDLGPQQVDHCREVVASVLQRADEPGELLAYWTSRYGRALPKPIKRGIADAVRRLYTERNLLKWDSRRRGFRFADVIELVHPSPDEDKPWQGPLFQHILDRRHGNADDVPPQLGTLRRRAQLCARAVEDPSVLLDSDALRQAAMTWEDTLSLAGRRVDRAQLWQALVPVMNYQALLRNLANFDRAGVSDEVAAQAAARLADPDEVARSRQFPFRFLAAYRAAPSLRWGHALDQALHHSLGNVPQLPGRTLVLVDRSGSMHKPTSKRSKLTFADSATVFGAALALRNLPQVTLVQYGDSSQEVPVPAGGSLLTLVNQFRNMGGTATAQAVQRHYDGHDRVVIVTDEQAHPRQGDPGDYVPPQVPLYVFNLAGYEHGHQAGGPNRVTLGGGLTDHAFRLIPLLEAGRDGAWPWRDQ